MELDLLCYQQVNPASTLSEWLEAVRVSVSVCVCACLYWRQLKIGSISVTTLGEHQHLVLKVIQSPERNIQIAAISLLDYKWMDASVCADKNWNGTERPDDKQTKTVKAGKKEADVDEE